MREYLFFIAIFLVEGCMFKYISSVTKNAYLIKNNGKLYCGLMTLQFLLMSALRDYSVGADTLTYVTFFERTNYHFKWSEMGTYMLKGLIGQEGWFEPLFVLFTKTVYSFTTNARIWLFIIAVFIMIPLGIFVYKYSRDYCMSFMIYMCLFFQCFGITAIRQAMALTIVTFLGYKYVKERKIWGFLLCVIIAFYFHHSAIVMLPLYFIYNIKLNKKMRIVYCMGYGAVFILRNQILQLSALLTGGYYKFPGGQRPSNMVIIMTLLTLFCLWKYDKLSEIRSDNNGVINAVLIGTLFLPFTQINGTYMRLCYYYYMFLMILIPEILLLFPKKWKNIFTVCAYIGMIALFARHGLQYSFFWQA